VKRLVDLMHGRIEVSSELGRGTEFDVYLKFPKVNGPAEAGRSAAAEPFSLLRAERYSCARTTR
jgi:hypothetical protein